MSDFWPNVAANLIGTLVGAVIAIGAAMWTQRRSSAGVELRRLQAIIDRLHRSRALRPDRHRDNRPYTDAEIRDRERCATSILMSRDQVASVRDDLVVHVSARDDLQRMYLRCLAYLDEAEERDYVVVLMQLREGLNNDVCALATRVKGLRYFEPGAAAVEVL